MKRMKKISLWAVVLLVSCMFIAIQAIAAEPKDEPGVGKGPESGIKPGYEHQKTMGEKYQNGEKYHKGEGYYHKGMMKNYHGIRGHRASELIGKDVVSADGQEIGELEDIIIFRGGRVHYGIISTGDKYVPVPYFSLQRAEDKDQLMVNLDKEKIENAPGLNEEQLGTWWESDIGDEVHTYYGFDRMEEPGVGKGPESGFPEEKTTP